MEIVDFAVSQKHDFTTSSALDCLSYIDKYGWS